MLQNSLFGAQPPQRRPLGCPLTILWVSSLCGSVCCDQVVYLYLLRSHVEAPNFIVYDLETRMANTSSRPPCYMIIWKVMQGEQCMIGKGCVFLNNKNQQTQQPRSKFKPLQFPLSILPRHVVPKSGGTVADGGAAAGRYLGRMAKFRRYTT